MLTPLNSLFLTSCSDEPDSDHYYTFTGEMMSDYLKNHLFYPVERCSQCLPAEAWTQQSEPLDGCGLRHHRQDTHRV